MDLSASIANERIRDREMEDKSVIAIKNICRQCRCDLHHAYALAIAFGLPFPRGPSGAGTVARCWQGRRRVPG